MSAIYIITHTDPAVGAITVAPNKFDGPESTYGESTNLTLYGAGSLQYGSEFNENFVKLLENFSSPGILAGSPPSWVPATLVGSPGTEVIADVTTNYFNPATVQVGQTWFNSSAQKLMVYDGTDWIVNGRVSSGPQAPSGKQIGDLWFDTSANALKALESTGPDVWSGVAGDYLLKAGDTMSGDLQMSSNEVLGLPASPSATGAASKEYVDTQDALKLNLAGGTLTGDLTLDGDPTSNLHSATKQYVDTGTALLQKVYPLNSLYMSVASTNPNTILGFGTWTAILGQFLVGTGDNGDGFNYGSGGATGGDKDAVVVSHSHGSAGSHTHSTSGGGTPANTGASGDTKAVLDQPGNTGSSGSHTHPSAGVSGTDMNIPPYFAIYIWQRTA